MALSIGELVGYIDLDASAAEKSASGIGGMLEKLGGSWGGVLGAAGAGGALAFGAGLVAGMSDEVGSDMLAASLGGGNKLAERYGDIAGQVYSNGFGEGLGDVNDAMGAVITSIKGMRSASDKEVQSMTEKAMTYADVMGIDVTRAAQVAGNMVNNGLAKNGSQAFDLLMKASQKVPVQLREDVLDATDEYGQFFTQLGIGGPEAMGLLAKGAEKGMYGIDKAGDAIKEFTIRATDGSKSTLTAIESIGLSGGKMSNDLLAGGDKAKRAFDKTLEGILSIKDPTAQAGAALALFGTPLEDLGTKDIPAFLQSLQGGEGSLGKFAGSVDKAGQTAYDNASTNLTMFTRTLKTGFVDLVGGSVLPKVNELTGALATGLGPAWDTVASAASATVGWLKQHQTVAGVLVGVVGGLVAVTAAHSAVMAVSAAGGMAKWLAQTKLISTATKVWTAIQWAMNAALAANPIVLVVAALVAIGVALVVAYKKSETFRNIVKGALQAVQNAASALGGFFKKWGGQIAGALSSAWGAIKGGATAAWNAIKGGATTAWNAIKGAVQGGVDQVRGAIDGLQSIPGKVSDWFGRARQAVSEKLDSAVAYVKGVPGRITSAIGNLGSLLYNAGASVIQGLIDGITAKVGQLRDKLQSVTKLIPDWKGPAETDKKLLRRNGQLIMGGLMDGIDDGTKGLKSLLQDVTEKLGSKRLAKVEKAVSDEYARGLRIGAKRKATAEKIEEGKKALEDAIKVRDDFKASLLPPSALETARGALADAISVRDSFNASLLPPSLLESARSDLSRLQGLYDQLKATVADGARAFASIGNVQLSEDTTAGDVVQQMRDKLAQVTKFRSNMAKLLEDGLDMASYERMMADGVEKSGAMAELLVEDPAAVAAVSQLSAQIEAAASGMGIDAADAMHGAGLSAANGLVDTLTTEQVRMNESAVAAAQALVNTLTAQQLSLNEAGVAAAQAVLDGLELDEAALASKAEAIAEAIRKALSGALGVAVDASAGAAGNGGNGGGKGKGKDDDKGKNGGKGKNGRDAPLIGQVVQRKGESADELAERLWFKTRKRG